MESTGFSGRAIYATEIENKEEVFNFAFLYKVLRKVNNGYISVEGVCFFVRHLIAELEDGKRLGRGRKRTVNELFVAIHPENLTKAWIYIPSEDGLPYEGRKWKLLGIVNAENLLPADERTLTGKAKKTRKKRTLRRKAEKLYQKLNKVQSELIQEETKPAKDEFDQFLAPEEDIELPTYSEEELLPPNGLEGVFKQDELDRELTLLEVPIFRNPSHALRNTEISKMFSRNTPKRNS